ncbi:MAG: hypothetical protein DRI54_03655 [Bacteroidetes bacterium]|nr:MAG: hypothetical protein DRI54_03655 [Bacteroidota bacterium]
MKNENWSIRKMREERLLSTLKNTYRENDQNMTVNKIEDQDRGNQTTLSLFLNRVKILLEDEPG